MVFVYKRWNRSSSLSNEVYCKLVFGDLQIPAGTSSHTRVRLMGKGISRQSSYGNGDLYVHIKIKVPRWAETTLPLLQA